MIEEEEESGCSTGGEEGAGQPPLWKGTPEESGWGMGGGFDDEGDVTVDGGEGKRMDLNENWRKCSCYCFVFVDKVLFSSGSGSLHIREPRS